MFKTIVPTSLITAIHELAKDIKPHDPRAQTPRKVEVEDDAAYASMYDGRYRAIEAYIDGHYTVLYDIGHGEVWGYSEHPSKELALKKLLDSAVQLMI